MKKTLSKIIFILFTFLPFIAEAYGIENYFINATLQPNGDLHVQEYFNMNGEFNGFERIILYGNSNAYDFIPELEYYGGSSLHNGSNIDLNKIMAVPINSNFDFENVKGDTFTITSSAKKGDYGVYEKTFASDGYSYLIYLPSDKNKAFYIEYTIKNLAILHDDVGEIGWNIFGNQLTESIENLRVTVNFPNNETVFRVWAHGPLNGVVTKENQTKLIASVTGLAANKAIDIRATFDTAIISQSTKKTNVSALTKILAYEEDVANQANYERKQQDIKRQEEALTEIKYCYEHLNRYCYENSASIVKNILDEDVKAEYTRMLEELNLLVTNKEETTAKESVKSAETYLKYYNYEWAIESVSILKNEELKKELTDRLDEVKERLIQEEKSSYKKIKIYLHSTIIVIIGIIAYMYYYHDREYKSSFKEDYLREKPNNYSPSTVSYLFNRKITNEAISAEILELINKGIITCEKITTNKKDDYILSKNTKYKKALSAKEEALVKLVTNNSNSIKLSEVKKKASSSYRSFLSRWNKVQSYCIEEALDEDIYIDDELAKYKKGKKGSSNILGTFLFVIGILLVQSIILMIPGIILLYYTNKIGYTTQTNIDIKKSTSKKISITILIILLVLSLISMFYIHITYHFVSNPFILSTITLMLSIIALIYVSNCQKRTEEGAYEFSRWQAFKRFLCDFGKMDIKEVGEVKLWKEYLVYATVLGCADKVEKAMKLKVKELDIAETDFTISDYYIFNNISNDISRGIRDAHNKAVSSQTASSSGSSSSGSSGSWSSGGGGGGGFSSGGGSFGGGGGGGRF